MYRDDGLFDLECALKVFSDMVVVLLDAGFSVDGVSAFCGQSSGWVSEMEELGRGLWEEKEAG